MPPTATWGASESTRRLSTRTCPLYAAESVTMEVRDEIGFVPTFSSSIPEPRFQKGCEQKGDRCKGRGPRGSRVKSTWGIRWSMSWYWYGYAKTSLHFSPRCHNSTAPVVSHAHAMLPVLRNKPSAV